MRTGKNVLLRRMNLEKVTWDNYNVTSEFARVPINICMGLRWNGCLFSRSLDFHLSYSSLEAEEKFKLIQRTGRCLSPTSTIIGFTISMYARSLHALWRVLPQIARSLDSKPQVVSRSISRSYRLWRPDSACELLRTDKYNSSDDFKNVRETPDLSMWGATTPPPPPPPPLPSRGDWKCSLCNNIFTLGVSQTCGL